MIDTIKKLGLNEYESKAYSCLLQKGGLSAVSISRAAGIPRARIYDILASLESKGFVIRSASKQSDFSAVNPTKAFLAISEQKKNELETSLKELSSVAQFLEKHSSDSGGFAEESAWLVKGRNNIYAQIAQQAQNCNASVLISSSPEGIIRKKNYLSSQKNASLPLSIRLLSRESDSRFVVFDNKAVMLFLNNEKVGEKEEKALLIRSPFVANLFSKK